MSVYAKGGYLYIDFRCLDPRGVRLRCQEATRLKDTKANRKAMEIKDQAIRLAKQTGTFDYLKFFPDGAKAKLFKDSASDMLFTKAWDLWMSEKSLRENTERGWTSAFNLHIKPYFGHYQIDMNNLFGKPKKGEHTPTINENGNGFLVPSSKNHKLWVKYIKYLVDNPNMISELGNRLYNTVNGTYDMVSVCKDRLELYNKLVTEKKSISEVEYVEENV